jgi:hyperosmotically inducible protein
MKIKLVASCLLIGSLLSPLAVYAEDSDTDRTHPITFVKDSYITTKVKAMLADEKMKTLLHVTVDTDAKGAVTLGGIARSKADADKAVLIASEVKGVTSVTNNIQIKKDD